MSKNEQSVTLRDGVSPSSLVDREDRSLSARVFTDPEIFDQEMKRIFARTWIPVAHVTEMPNDGDFVLRRIGLDSVIVTHMIDPDGDEDSFHIALNACSHRGTQVCRVDSGNTPGHKCPYHGWTFSGDGSLLGVPFERQMYANNPIDKKSLGLATARCETYGGILFGCWDPAAPSLDEFLGDWKWYADIYLNRSDSGMEVAGPPQRWVVDANWKVVCDGFFGDAYHVLGVHSSFGDIGFMPPGDMALHTRKVTFSGHTVLGPALSHHGIEGSFADVLAKNPPSGMSPDLVDQIERNLSPEQLALLGTTPPSIFGMWPIGSMIYIGSGLTGPLGQVVSLRFFCPLGPDRTEIVNFSLVERDANEDFKQYVHRTSISNFGVGGFFETDDVEVWESVQRGMQGVMGSRLRARYPSKSGEVDEEFSGPGDSYRGISSDDNQWSFYMRWAEFMESDPWAKGS